MNRIPKTWCDTCQEWTLAEPGERCAWCDTTVRERRGGWKRPDTAARSRISPAQARALHAAHQAGRSLRHLSNLTWEALGYASAKSCLEGIRYAFAREGLSVRDRADATSLSNRQRSIRLPGETKNELKRRRRREHGYRDTRTGEWRLAGVQAVAEEAAKQPDRRRTSAPSS